jgi:hypothetical protein
MAVRSAHSRQGDDSVWFGIEYLFGMWGENLNPRSPDTSFLAAVGRKLRRGARGARSFLSFWRPGFLLSRTCTSTTTHRMSARD